MVVNAMAGLMTKEQILQVLREHLPELRTRFGVRRLALYGSFARGSASEQSDVDLLVELEAPWDCVLWSWLKNWNACWAGGLTWRP
ncbi:MAG: nucleotidyltransferase family protein [Candidatus Bipolaricaulaceae bacterium]